MSEPLWKKIAPLRGIAICLVVANHAGQSATAAFVLARERLSPYEEPLSFLTVSLVRALTPVCLIAFVFASGFMAFRFMRTTKQALPAAAQMLRRYLGWSGFVLVLLALRHRSIDLPLSLHDLAVGSAMPAYWFLLTLIPLYATGPYWISLCTNRPKLVLGIAATLQSASCIKFYVVDLNATAALPLWDMMLVRPLRFLPAFLAGMLVSRDAERVGQWLAAHRRSLTTATVLYGGLCLADAFALDGLADFRWTHMDRVFSTERPALILFAALCISLAIAADFQRPRVQAWFANVGSASLGIMFLMDFFIVGATKAWWQLARLSSPDGATALARHTLPPSFADASLWITPLLFAIGLWGPLKVMELARKLLGQRARYLW
jgi:fucose 4-O-acetylase-like acetyltransferase